MRLEKKSVEVRLMNVSAAEALVVKNGKNRRETTEGNITFNVDACA